MARHRPKGRRCTFESLENRRMLAGDVTARIENGDLVIEGDDLDNGITIAAGDNAGEVVVTGVDAGGSATNVNGTANGEVTLTGFTGGLRIDMQDGNDSVSISDLTVSGKAKLKGGKGDDQFNLESVVFENSLKLKLGKGDDTASLTGVHVSDETKFKGRRGDDDVTIEDSTFTELKVKLGKGDDNLAISGTTVTEDTDLNGRSGTNDFTNGPGNSLADLDVKNFNERVITGPTLTISGPESVNEGALYTLGLSATGTGASTITQWTINWGDGSTPQVVNGNPTSVTHTFTDGNATRTISATATNPDGTFDARNTITVTVNNVAPTLTLSGATTVNEGALYTLNLSKSDPGADTITQWTIDWNNGTPAQTVTGNPASVTHTFTDGPATRTISATATDEDGTFVAGNTVTVSVTNVAPTLSISGAASINEGALYTLNLSSSDPGTDTITQWTINWGDGTPAQTVTGSPSSVTHTFTDGNATRTISATATDEDGTFNAANTVNVTVNNVAPTLSISGASSVNEGALYTLNLSSSDPGADTITQWAIQWGDLSPIQFATGNPASVTHTYGDGPGTRTISAAATDEDGTFAAGNTVTVTINNVAPTLSISGASSVNEGALYTLNLSSSDPGVDTISQWTINWGDGTPNQVVPGNPASVTHTFAEGPNNFTISATATDEDGTFNAGNSVTVTVNNVAPTVQLLTAPTVVENGTATLNGSYRDVGLRDAHSLTVDWGDPNNSTDSVFAIPAIQNGAGVQSLNVGDMFNSSTDGATLTITSIDTAGPFAGQVAFSVQHQYLDDGPAPGNGLAADTTPLGVTVVDDDGNSSSASTSVTVGNSPPEVVLNPISGILENGFATLTGTYTDIGLLDGHTLTVNWGDPNNSDASTFTIPAIQDAAGNDTLNVNDTFNSADGAVLKITAIDATTGEVDFSIQHQYLDDGTAPGDGSNSNINTISASIADDDGQSDSDTRFVTISNASPDLSLNSVPDIAVNEFATLTGNYTDVGLLDEQMLVIQWGDATSNSTFQIDAIQDASGATTLTVGEMFNSTTDGAILTITSIDATTGKVGFSVKHQYTTTSIFNIGATVTDDDTDSDTGSTTVTVGAIL